ncbi:aldehyde ferredoxin oxidoreductase family protein [Thermodesulfobacteriota bacterium]
MKGYNGQILRINLTNAEINVEKRTEDFYKHYLGGRGFIIYTMLTEIPKGIDPLGPENKLVFALGPITGHPLIGSGRNSIGAKSPLTGAFGESEVGGFWGVELKKAGYDALIVEGVSPRPVYILINNENVEICDASNLWGAEVAETEKALQKEVGKVRTAIIGPSGELMVRFASIFNDISHVAGRTGMGAVMGSKKLKAIAVKGAKVPEIADRKKIIELSSWMSKNYKEKTHLHKYGTGLPIVSYEESGLLPIKNFRGGRFAGAENITAKKMYEKGYIEKMDNCFGCPIRCKKKVKINEPWTVDPVYGGPEYETLAAFGSNCGIDNLEAIIKAHEICCRYGIDTMSTGVCISFAMECFENKIITLEDTNGIELTFGNSEAMLEMVEQIALRKGFGKVLAEGTKLASEKIGKNSAEYAMHVKGLEIPMHEPRFKAGMALHYSVHPTGADHVTGTHDDLIEKNPENWDSLDISVSMPKTELSPRKARMVYHISIWRSIVNYLGLCLFVPWTYKQIRDAMEYITGWPMSFWKLMKAVERGITLARIYNLREGFTVDQDVLPRRFSTSPTEGPLQDTFIDPEKLIEAQRVYYQMFGWDDSGIPTFARLVELDMEWAQKYIEEIKNTH